MVDQFAELSRGRLHFRTAGNGNPVVLLHGWPGFSFDYRLVLPAAAEHGLVIAPDFFGFGDSDPLSDPLAADEDAFAQDVLGLLDFLGLERAVLVGYDIGSAVAPAAARLAPQRVTGLVLLNPTHPYIGAKRYTPAAQREAWYQHFHLLPLAGQLIDGDRGRVELYLAHFYTHWAGEARVAPQDLAAIVDVYTRPGAFTSSLAWYRARAARRDRGGIAPPVGAPVEAPTIALWGDRDPMRPLEHREGFERTFPRSTSAVLPGVGHFVPAEAPDAVVAAIIELLGTTSCQ
jgi:pimeloyl-ACP methyl ester carboxylesterase